MIFSIGFAATYFTAQLWFPLAILTLACHGIAFSFAYATAIGAAQKWFSPEKKGFVGSLVVSGYGFGSLFWVPIQTVFVNPKNVKAKIDQNCSYVDTDHEDRCDFYFVDEDLLQRVPWMFVLLGGIYVAMGLVSVFLISDPPEDRDIFNFLDQEVAEKESPKRDFQWKKVPSLSPLEVLKTPVFYQVGAMGCIL